MGLHHIVSVANDALEMNKDRRAEIESALGKAIFTVCADPQFGHLGTPTLERVTRANVLNYGSAVRHAAELHHTDYEVLVFSGGHLRPLRELKGEELSEFTEYVRRISSF